MDCIKKRLETLGIKHQGDPTAEEEEEALESDQYRPKVPNGNIKPGGDKRKHPPHLYPHPRPHHYAQHRLYRNQRRSYQDIPDTVATDEDPPPYPYPYNCYPRLRRTKNTANDYYHNPYFYRDQRRNHAKRDQPSREFFHARDEKLDDLYDPDFVDLDPGDLNLDPPPVALDPDEPQFEIPRPPMGVRHHQHQHPPHPHPHPHLRHHHYHHYYEPSIDSEPRGRDRRPRPNTNNPPPAPKPPNDKPPSSTTSSKNRRHHGYHHQQHYSASYDDGDDPHGPPPPPRPRRKRADPTASATSSSAAAAAAADGGAKKKRNRKPAASEATDFAYSKGAFVPNDDGVSDVSAPRRARLPLPAPTTTTTTTKAPSGSARGGGGGARRSGEPLGSSEEEEFGGDGWVDLEDGYEYGGGAGEDGDWVDEDEDEDEGRPVVSGTELSLRSKDRRRGAADSLMDEEEAVAYGRGGGRGDEVPWSPGWEVSSIRTFSDGEGDVDADGFVNGARGNGRGFFDYARQARARRKGERMETGGGGGGVDGRGHETRGPGVPRRGFERSRDTPWDASSPYLSPTASTDDWHPGFMAGRSPHPNARYRGRQRDLDSEVDHAAAVAAAAAAAQRRKDRKKKEHRSPTPTRPAAPPPPSTSGALSSLRPPRTPSEAARCALGVSAVGLCAAGVKRVVSQAIKWEVEKQVQERLVEEKMERRRRRAKKREEKERKWRERDRLEREAVMAGGRPSLGRRMMSGGKAGIERMRSGGRSARMDSIDKRGDRERLFRGNEVDEEWVDDDDTAEGFPIESEGDFDPGPRRGWRRGWSRSRTPRERGAFYQRPVPRTEPWRRGGGTFESIPLSTYADKGKGVANSGHRGGGPARRLLSDVDTSEIASFITPVGSKPAYAR